MKLYYFKATHGNFGDDLNPWLWERIMPGVLDDDPAELFVGIGTLLNHRLPSAPVKHVFGSGFGYGTPPRIDERYVIHAVRGYETAKMLGIDADRVITDAAVLLRTIVQPPAWPREFRFGFVPHHQSSRYFDWQTVCDEVGFHHVSAEWDVETVLAEMGRCEVLICEAMHGAIAADTLRIPWIPVSCYDYISEFKWQDWLSTLDLPYEPLRVTSLYDIERFLSPARRARNSFKRSLRSIGMWSRHWTPPPVRKTGPEEFGRAVRDLKRAAESPPRLSADALLDQHVGRYVELVERFRISRR